MSNDFDRAKDLYKWNEILFRIMGVWPLKDTYITFTIWILYALIHLSMSFTDLYQVFGNMELMITNLSETTMETMILVKLPLLRFSRTLKKLMTQIIDGIDTRLFEGDEEKKIYLNYNGIAKFFFKAIIIFGTVTSTMYHMKPLESRLRSALGNESLPFVLPYRTRLFFDVHDSSTFWMVWIYQMPLIYVHSFHSMTIAYLFSLILHICGQLSVLAHRIKNLNVGSRDDTQNVRSIFRDITKRHRNIMSLARDINKVFHLMLLEELFVSTVILGLTSYSVIVNSDFTDKVVFLNKCFYLLYGLTMILLILGYCVAGEYLITESMNLYEAYYQCQWQDVSISFRKQLIICMIGASKPLKLTGGGYYIFSMSSFTQVLKTAAGYMSMLREMTKN